MKMRMELWWNDTCWGKLKVLQEKPGHISHIGLYLNLCLNSDRAATNCLNHSVATLPFV